MTPLIVDIECVAIDGAADFIEPPQAPDNYKKPEAIEKYIKEATAKAVDRCALDPDLCQIVAIGVAGTTGAPSIYVCDEFSREADGLKWLLARLLDSSGSPRPIISFNGFGYDLPVLMRRAQYLGVDFPNLSVDRYRSPHIDLMQKLTFNGAIKPHSLKFYASRFGFAFEDDVLGNQIAELVRQGAWDAVRSHCQSDVLLTRFLAQKLKLIPQSQSVAA